MPRLKSMSWTNILFHLTVSCVRRLNIKSSKNSLLLLFSQYNVECYCVQKFGFFFLFLPNIFFPLSFTHAKRSARIRMKVVTIANYPGTLSYQGCVTFYNILFASLRINIERRGKDMCIHIFSYFFFFFFNTYYS